MHKKALVILVLIIVIGVSLTAWAVLLRNRTIKVFVTKYPDTTRYLEVRRKEAGSVISFQYLGDEYGTVVVMSNHEGGLVRENTEPVELLLNNQWRAEIKWIGETDTEVELHVKLRT